MRLAEACIPFKNNFMDAELFKCAAVYDAERDVFKNFIKRHKQTTCFTSNDIYNLVEKDIFPNMLKLVQVLLTTPQT